MAQRFANGTNSVLLACRNFTRAVGECGVGCMRSSNCPLATLAGWWMPFHQGLPSPVVYLFEGRSTLWRAVATEGIAAERVLSHQRQNERNNSLTSNQDGNCNLFAAKSLRDSAWNCDQEFCRSGSFRRSAAAFQLRQNPTATNRRGYRTISSASPSLAIRFSMYSASRTSIDCGELIESSEPFCSIQPDSRASFSSKVLSPGGA